MTRIVTDFQIFAKPVSYQCNLRCAYCYYLKKDTLFATGESLRMADDLLELYICQHLAAHPGPKVYFSWHGGEPTLLGLDYFRRIVDLQQKHCPKHKSVVNGIQTNGTLINDEWAGFLAKHHFSAGLSLDGPQDIHDFYRRSSNGSGTHPEVMRGYFSLTKHGVPVDILCVVNQHNVMYPLQVYNFFKSIGVLHLSFLPLVEPLSSNKEPKVSAHTVGPEAFGAFLCTIFDIWVAEDIGTIKVQIFEEATRTAFGQDHSLCLFRPTCGDIPVIEHNGDVFACDHFVDEPWKIGNIRRSPLSSMLSGKDLANFGEAKRATLPEVCKTCEVLSMCNGECPKNRFIDTPGEIAKRNYLCAGYKLFFTHCGPFVNAVSQHWQNQQANAPRPKQGNTGRNDPCPCGSGRKYKKCCQAT